jgi:hypothetical protein
MATKLEKFYEDAFGAPQSRGELYTGFFLLITGFVLSIVGILIFLGLSRNFSGINEYNWREIGGVIGALGPPAILVGISVTLPTRWTMRILDAIGSALCLGGIGVFMYLYPHKWNTGTGQEIWGVLLFVAGCAALLASTLSSLIGYYVSRATGGGAGVGDVTASDYNYDIPDSVIEKDIELAMRRYNVSWGGEGAEQQHKGVQFNVNDEFAAGTIIGGKGVARSVTLDAPQVDTATDKLRSLRGTKGVTSLDTKGVDDTTSALLKFRQQKAQKEAEKARGGFWNAIKRLFGIKPKPAAAAKPAGAKPGAPMAPPMKK